MAVVTSGNLLSNGSLVRGMSSTNSSMHRAQLSFNTLELPAQAAGCPMGVEVPIRGGSQHYRRGSSAGHQGNSEAPFCSLAGNKDPVDWHHRRRPEYERKGLCHTVKRRSYLWLACVSSPRVPEIQQGEPKEGFGAGITGCCQ